MKPEVSIIIVNWNGLKHLPENLESLSQQTFRDFEVILVDNGSQDGSPELVRENYPWVRLIELERNFGFASGNNQGLKHCQGTFIVTLNNDTRVAPNWLEVLVQTARKHPKAGMVGSLIRSYFDPEIIDSAGMGICSDAMSRGRYRNRRFSSLNLPEVSDILFPSACAALYRREMIEEIGFFDDDFFAYAEDSDLGLRGRVAGWDALLATRAVVYHKYSQTSGNFSPFKVYLVERNHYWVALKSFPLSQLILLPFYTSVRYFEQARAILRGRGAGGEFRNDGSKAELVKALIRGVCHSLAGLPNALFKRRRVMKTRRLPTAEFSRLLNHHRISFRELLDYE